MRGGGGGGRRQRAVGRGQRARGRDAGGRANGWAPGEEPRGGVARARHAPNASSPSTARSRMVASVGVCEIAMACRRGAGCAGAASGDSRRGTFTPRRATLTKRAFRQSGDELIFSQDNVGPGRGRSRPPRFGSPKHSGDEMGRVQTACAFSTGCEAIGATIVGRRRASTTRKEHQHGELRHVRPGDRPGAHSATAAPSISFACAPMAGFPASDLSFRRASRGFRVICTTDEPPLPSHASRSGHRPRA